MIIIRTALQLLLIFVFFYRAGALIDRTDMRESRSEMTVFDIAHLSMTDFVTFIEPYMMPTVRLGRANEATPSARMLRTREQMILLLLEPQWRSLAQLARATIAREKIAQRLCEPPLLRATLGGEPVTVSHNELDGKFLLQFLHLDARPSPRRARSYRSAVL